MRIFISKSIRIRECLSKLTQLCGALGFHLVDHFLMRILSFAELVTEIAHLPVGVGARRFTLISKFGFFLLNRLLQFAYLHTEG